MAGVTLLVLAGNCTYLVLSLLVIAFVQSETRTGNMVGLQYDCLQNPLGAVRLTFEKAVASGSDPATFNGKDWGATTIFRDFLIDKGCLSQVPILSSESISWLKPNSLVRFRGMIQDMLGNEFYVGAYKDGSIWRTNKFMDVSQFPMCSSSDMQIWERRLLYCVPVPGQNLWVDYSSKPLINQYENLTILQREKRQREDDSAIDHMDLSECVGSLCNKKMREGGSIADSSQQQEPETVGTFSITHKMTDFDKNYLPCLVKIYDSPESEMKLNDIVEFVGIFTFGAELEKGGFDEVYDGLCEDALVHRPSAKIPCLHCFIHRKLATDELLSSSFTPEPSHLVKEIRKSLLGHLTSVLGNDGLAAHFMLLHLLSKVHARVDSVAVGKLSLNLTSFNEESISVFGNRISVAVKKLLPFTHHIPLTVEYLNSTSLAPRKDYQTDRLETAVLQLAEGSHITIDETQLKAGTLNSTGVENAMLLKNLIELQKVDYDFKYYKMEMAADVQLLVLSEVKSNILPADIVLPFQPSSVCESEPVPLEALEAWRWYLATLRSTAHSIEPEMQKVVEDDLVAARQADRSLGSHDFSRWLTVGRLISASFGETCLSLDHWEMVKELERLRRERLK